MVLPKLVAQNLKTDLNFCDICAKIITRLYNSILWQTESTNTFGKGSWSVLIATQYLIQILQWGNTVKICLLKINSNASFRPVSYQTEVTLGFSALGALKYTINTLSIASFNVICSYRVASERNRLQQCCLWRCQVTRSYSKNDIARIQKF